MVTLASLCSWTKRLGIEATGEFFYPLSRLPFSWKGVVSEPQVAVPKSPISLNYRWLMAAASFLVTLLALYAPAKLLRYEDASPSTNEAYETEALEAEKEPRLKPNKAPSEN